MKFPRRFLFETVDGIPKIVITGVDLIDILGNITYLIQYIYGRFKGKDPRISEAFRTMLLETLNAPNSLVWSDVEDTPGATEICLTMPK